MKKFTLILVVAILGISYADAQVNKVHSVSITVSSLEELTPFYTELLQFEEVGRDSYSTSDVNARFGLNDNNIRLNTVTLQLGEQQIQLMEFVNEDTQRPIPADSKSNDLWFQHVAIVVSDMWKAYERLAEYGVEHVSTLPQTLPEYIPAAAGISAFYFRDPDGHNLEIISYPEGKGNPAWQDKSALFLGIDHTAISIAETKTSQAFYEGALGMEVAGNSRNYGSEQEHLNQVFGAHLLITGLKTDAGFGVEFLDYIAPPGGRTYPEGSLPTDLWHWHITFETEDLAALKTTLKSQGFSMIAETNETALLRDPDGHAIYLTTSNSTN